MHCYYCKLHVEKKCIKNLIKLTSTKLQIRPIILILQIIRKNTFDIIIYWYKYWFVRLTCHHFLLCFSFFREVYYVKSVGELNAICNIGLLSREFLINVSDCISLARMFTVIFYVVNLAVYIGADVRYCVLVLYHCYNIR